MYTTPQCAVDHHTYHVAYCLGSHFRQKFFQNTYASLTAASLIESLQVEGVWLQDFPSQFPTNAPIGSCLVIKGKQAVCGLLPATHLTANPHIVIPLRAMSKAGREHWITVVLPAWQSVVGIVTSPTGPGTLLPLPVELQPAYRYWLQGARKRYMVLQTDEDMESLLLALDMPRRQQQQHLGDDLHEVAAVAAQL